MHSIVEYSFASPLSSHWDVHEENRFAIDLYINIYSVNIVYQVRNSISICTQNYYKLSLLLLQRFTRMQLNLLVHLTKEHVHSECIFAELILWNNRVKKVTSYLVKVCAIA